MKKNNNVKKAICLFMSVVLLMSYLSVFASAAIVDPGNNDPMFTVITACTCALIIDGINSTSTATLQTARSTNLKITMELQKLKSGTYSTIETWTKTGSGGMLLFEKDRLINVLSTYRLRVTFDAGNETHVMYAYPRYA